MKYATTEHTVSSPNSLKVNLLHIAILLSLFVHFFVLWLIHFVPEEVEVQRVLKITKIGREEEKDSEQHFFNTRNQAPVDKKLKSNILPPQAKKIDKKKRSFKRKVKERDGEGISLNSEQFSIESYSKPQIHKIDQMNFQNLKSANFGNTDLNISLKVPKGVTPDELNRIEEVFFSFSSRVYEKFILSILETLREYGIQFPHQRVPVNRDFDTIYAVLRLDSNGDVVSVRLTKGAKQEFHDRFFIDSLEKMNRISNPPRALLDDDGEMEIKFGLILNRND